MSAVKYSLDKNIPDCMLKLVKNQPLAKSSSKDKDAHHFKFKFGSSAIKAAFGAARLIRKAGFYLFLRISDRKAK
uniref:NADPH-dependent diflavin oxidoreductase 1-like n=1 Tax=Fragaria vesca subsp. vesca TaxID=101020 RepID=UPI0005CB5A3E|nr:PREDICTED: NADPH-dependent diflavin oxidoreductase 1-like [Fragaria vesca subsp. vesca]